MQKPAHSNTFMAHHTPPYQQRKSDSRLQAQTRNIAVGPRTKYMQRKIGAAGAIRRQQGAQCSARVIPPPLGAIASLHMHHRVTLVPLPTTERASLGWGGGWMCPLTCSAFVVLSRPPRRPDRQHSRQQPIHRGHPPPCLVEGIDRANKIGLHDLRNDTRPRDQHEGVEESHHGP